MTFRSSATTSRRNLPNLAKMFGRLTAVAAARLGVAAPLASETPALAADRRAAARAAPADTAPVLTAAVEPMASSGSAIGRRRSARPRCRRLRRLASACRRPARPTSTTFGCRRRSGFVRRVDGGRLLPVAGHPVVIVAHSFTSSRPVATAFGGAVLRLLPCHAELLQGRQELNLQPAVLETAALPIELRPFGRFHRRLPGDCAQRNPSRKSGMCPPARHTGKRQHTPERPV